MWSKAGERKSALVDQTRVDVSLSMTINDPLLVCAAEIPVASPTATYSSYDETSGQ